MMARAASAQASAPSFARPAQSASTPSNRSASRGSPITPVEAMNTSFSAQPAAWVAICTVRATASRPRRPVKALALPELTTRARAEPPVRASRHQSTGAEGHFRASEHARAFVPGSSPTNSTSVRPL